MNSFNDEVCEYNYFSVTENFDSDNLCYCSMDYDPVICDGERYDNISCAIGCGQKNKESCYKEKSELL